MEAPDMTDDEARDLFSAYHDGELPPEQHERVRTALAERPELAKEYESFTSMLKALGALSVENAPPALQRPEDVPQADIIAGVQRRLHKRSGGKFYKDRWSRTAGIFPLEILAVLVLLALVAAYFAMTTVSVESAGSDHAPATTAPSR